MYDHQPEIHVNKGMTTAFIKKFWINYRYSFKWNFFFNAVLRREDADPKLKELGYYNWTVTKDLYSVLKDFE